MKLMLLDHYDSVSGNYGICGDRYRGIFIESSESSIGSCIRSFDDTQCYLTKRGATKYLKAYEH